MHKTAPNIKSGSKVKSSTRFRPLKLQICTTKANLQVRTSERVHAPQRHMHPRTIKAKTLEKEDKGQHLPPDDTWAWARGPVPRSWAARTMPARAHTSECGTFKFRASRVKVPQPCQRLTDSGPNSASNSARSRGGRLFARTRKSCKKPLYQNGMKYGIKNVLQSHFSARAFPTLAQKTNYLYLKQAGSAQSRDVSWAASQHKKGKKERQPELKPISRKLSTKFQEC